MNRLLTRLLLIVAVAMLPALGIQAYTESEARRTRQHLVEDEALRLVRLVSTEQQRIAEGADQVLATIGGAPAVQDTIPALCQRLLANVLEQEPRYNFIGVIGKDGHTICAPGPFDHGLDGSDRPFFRRALQTGGFAIGDYAIGRVTGLPTIHMAKPYRNPDGTVAGVVVLGLDLGWLGKQLEKIKLPPGAVVSVMDRNGTVLARVPGGMQFAGQRIPAQNRFILQGSDVGLASMTSLEGDRALLVAYSPPDGDPKGLAVGVGLDRDATFAAVVQANRNGMLLIAAGAALALAMTAMAGRHLIHRPLERLLRTADR
jgi:hypothetical protein